MRLAALALLSALSAAPSRAADYDCVIDPSETVDVAGATGGVVAEVFVEPGDRVTDGQLVARLDSTVERATIDILNLRANDTSAIEAQRSQLDFREAQLERTRALSKRGVVTREVLEEIQSSVESGRSLLAQAELAQRIAQQELRRAKAALARLEIRSPIDGIVTERYFDAGEYLPQEGRIATIVRLDPLDVVTFLPVSAYGSVREGDIATVHPAPPVKGDYAAEVTRIDRVFDVASGTFALHLRLDNADHAIPAGHRCTVTIDESS